MRPARCEVTCPSGGNTRSVAVSAKEPSPLRLCVSSEIETLTSNQDVVEVRLECDSSQINTELCERHQERNIKSQCRKTYERVTR